jgi:hypothetical protein
MDKLLSVQTIIAILVVVLFFAPMALHKFRQKNIPGVMIVYFILEPITFTIFIWFMLSVITRNDYVATFSPFLLLPIGCIFWLLMDKEDVAFLQKAKIALEWNLAISTAVSLVVAIYIILASNSDFQFIEHLFKSEDLATDGLDFRVIANLFFLTISFPFVVGFTLSKAFVEHILYNRTTSGI